MSAAQVEMRDDGRGRQFRVICVHCGFRGRWGSEDVMRHKAKHHRCTIKPSSSGTGTIYQYESGSEDFAEPM